MLVGENSALKYIYVAHRIRPMELRQDDVAEATRWQQQRLDSA